MTTKTQLNVLMVTPRYFPFMGGIETHVYEVSRRLVENGFSITVLTTDLSGQWPVQETVEGVKIRRVRAYPAKRDLYLAPALYREITSQNWDVVHCQGIHTFVPPLGMLAARRTGRPYLLTFHTGGHSEGWRRYIRKAQWRALRPLLAGADRLIGVSQFEATYFEQLLKLNPAKFEVIPNGGKLPQLPATIPPEALIETQPLIVSVGRLERYKGHQRAITALPGLLATHPQAHLMIVGSGPYEGELRKLATRLGLEKQVEFRSIPPGQRDQMAYLLSQARLVVLFSEYEAHPVAVMEALSLGRPVLVTATSGLNELAEKQLVRSIALDSTPAKYAAAIAEQLTRPFVPQQQLELPTWDECAARLGKLYTEVAASVRKEQPVCAF